MIKYLLKKILFEFTKFRYKNVRFLSNSFVVNSKFQGSNSIGENTKISNCNLGFGSYTGKNTELSKVDIGKFCSIGSVVKNTTGRHPSSIFVSSHPAFFSRGTAAGFTYSDKQKFEELKYVDNKYLVKIGNDVWIGDNVTILDGINIGDGAIIGVNSLVTKDIEPYSINVGVPAKLIRYRFEENAINTLLRFKWWNKDNDWIKSNFNKFENIDAFLDFIGRENIYE